MEIQSTIQAIRAGLMSRNEAVRGTGVDVEALDREIQTDNERADRLGLVLDSDPRKTTLQGLEQVGVTDAATVQ
jgi:capsid protein